MYMDYPGDTDAKRLARLALYERVRSMQPVEARHGNAAIVLAGTEASEIGLLKNYLGWDPQDCWFVDNTYKEGLKRVSQKWSDAKTVFGNVENVLKGVRNISFLNLDIMGYIDSEETEIFRIARPHIMDWGMVFCSFFRGREKKDTNIRKFLDSFKQATLDENRVMGYTHRMQAILGWEFVPVFSMTYTATRGGPGRTTAMGILGFQKVPLKTARSLRYMKHILPPLYGGDVPSDRGLQQSYLKSEALNLRNKGFNAKQSAEILNLHAGTVASWFSLY